MWSIHLVARASGRRSGRARSRSPGKTVSYARRRGWRWLSARARALGKERGSASRGSENRGDTSRRSQSRYRVLPVRFGDIVAGRSRMNRRRTSVLARTSVCLPLRARLKSGPVRQRESGLRGTSSSRIATSLDPADLPSIAASTVRASPPARED